MEPFSKFVNTYCTYALSEELYTECFWLDADIRIISFKDSLGVTLVYRMLLLKTVEPLFVHIYWVKGYFQDAVVISFCTDPRGERPLKECCSVGTCTDATRVKGHLQNAVGTNTDL